MQKSSQFKRFYLEMFRDWQPECFVLVQAGTLFFTQIAAELQELLVWHATFAARSIPI